MPRPRPRRSRGCCAAPASARCRSISSCRATSPRRRRRRFRCCRYDLEQRVTALARKLGLPVVTTFMGRGLLQDAPDVLLGTYLGAAGDPAISRLVEEADALLLLGVILSDTNFAL